MIKITLKYLVVFFFLTFFTSCVKDKDNTIRFSSWQSNPSEKRLTDSLLSTFTRKFPESKVKFELIPGNYSEKIQLMLGTHSAPQIFYIKDWLAPSYLRYDVLQPLDDFINKDTSFDKNDFYPQFLDAFTKNGKLYGLPKDFGPFVLFYNEKMFNEAGITEPPKDWKELEEYCRKLTKDTNGDGKIDQYGMVVEPSIDKLMPFALLVDDRTIIQGMRLIHQHLGIVSEPSGAVGIAAILENPDYFKNQTVATILCGGNLTNDQIKSWLTA